jgi:NADH dehydrogenase [ubiquinone] 1 alpha subcomplex assembly factor 5
MNAPPGAPCYLVGLPPSAATFEVIYMTGWAPHPRQQQPLQRGSATMSFEDLVSELGEGETEAEGGGGGGGTSTGVGAAAASSSPKSQ